MKIALIGGARPNFMKIAPLCWELSRQKIKYFLVNTGQHFSSNMSEDFFSEFKIQPDYSLKPSKKSVVKQFSDIMIDLEKIFEDEKPTVVIVVGDVNSTLAGALVANKMNIALVHVEAGLRSYNRLMPEESNRILVDHLSDKLFVTSEGAVDNLKKEGLSENIYVVGNVMMDTLESFLCDAGESQEHFYFCTLHRAENIDNKKIFIEILNALEKIKEDAPIYFSLHPRTKKMAERFGLMGRMKIIFNLLDPLSYRQSVYYQKNAQLVFTDSGGIQEETSYVGTPCITLRTETERPVTVKLGTNTIGGITEKSILEVYRNKQLKKKQTSIPYWDGRTAERIIEIITTQYDA
ncbi:MAG: UDP-N-acetylglucosamine 2-epimerase (non-hydrolyzing) [Candidatus Pacebacteria bacterium]|nr:UDP-N-acetylglucosamine 2-epimerase (non-hydrolyzing) [Candidatus Paceibacterota bacterium]